MVLRFAILSFYFFSSLHALDQPDSLEYCNAHQELILHKQHIYDRYLKGQAPRSLTGSGIDALYYHLNISVEYNPNKIECSVLARFHCHTDSITKITLDFDHSLTVDSISGAAKSFTQEGLALNISLNRTYYFDEIIEVEINYNGSPSPPRYSYFHFDTMPDGSPWLWTSSEPYGARYWWPCKDTPADKADSVDILITVPEDQLAASNGTLVNTKNNGDGTKTFHWRERYPITTYLVSLAVGNYAHFQEYYHYNETDSMLLDYYVFPEKLEEAKAAFSEMSDYLDALTYYFGPYPFLNEKYGQAQFGRGGGMEHQTLTSIGPVSIYARYLYVHELGHQWFGDAVTCASWTDIWLNEGFASYSEALYAEWAGYGGFPPGEKSYHYYMDKMMYLGDGTIIVQDTTQVSNIFDTIVYDKGAWVLHMLRKVLSDGIFFDVLKSYVVDQRWQYGSVRTDDFRTICEEKSGLHLSRFFEQWLNYPFYPEYEYSWTIADQVENKYDVQVTISQTQTTIFYDMPIDLLFKMASGMDTTVTVRNFQAEQTYLFQLPSPPIQVYLDKKNWILKNATEKETEDYTNDIIIKKVFPNPFRETVTIEVINWSVQHAEIHIFNLQGRLIQKISPIVSSKKLQIFTWTGINNHNVSVASGIYFVRPVLVNGMDKKYGSVRKIIYTR